jgi:hypothetical protein
MRKFRNVILGIAGAAITSFGWTGAQAEPAPAGHPGPTATIAVKCTVAAGATLTACEVSEPERLTEADRVRVLDRASKSTTDPALAVGVRRTFGIVEGLKDFAAAAPPRLALVREDALVGVGQCMWDNIGARGQQVVGGSLRIGASVQVTLQSLQAEPTYAPALAKCDPDHTAHPSLADTIIPAWAMREAAREHLARNQLAETSLRAAMAALPATRAAIELRTMAALRNSTEAANVDWAPYLARLHMLLGDPRARYAQLYFQAEAIHNVLIYQQLDAW